MISPTFNPLSVINYNFDFYNEDANFHINYCFKTKVEGNYFYGSIRDKSEGLIHFGMIHFKFHQDEITYSHKEISIECSRIYCNDGSIETIQYYPIDGDQINQLTNEPSLPFSTYYDNQKKFYIEKMFCLVKLRASEEIKKMKNFKFERIIKLNLSNPNFYFHH